MRIDTFSDLRIGQTSETIGVIKMSTVRNFAKISGDNNPLHLDSEYAKTEGFKDCIVPGALICSYFSGLIARELPGPGSIAVSMELKFRRPVYVNHLVSIKVEVLELDPRHNRVELACICCVEDYGNKPAIRGEAVVRFLK